MFDPARVQSPFLRRSIPLLYLLGAAVVAGIVALAGIIVVHLPLGDCEPHLPLQFTGEARCAESSRSELRRSLARDCGFALVYGGLLFLAASRIKEQDHLDRRLDVLNTIARVGPLAAAGADIAENGVLFLATTYEAARFVIADSAWAHVVAALALVKWTALAAAVAVLLLRIANFNPERRPAPPPAETAEAAVTARPELALCCSGGGIRSAAFSLGVLHALDEKGITDDVGMMAAVSGGNYAATGWCLANARGCPDPASEVIKGLLEGRDPLEQPGRSILASVRADHSPVRERVAHGKHRYLANGPGGLPRAIGWAALAVASTLLQLLAVIVVVAWPLGKLLTTDALYPHLGAALEMDAPFAVADRQWLPLAILAAAGSALVAVTPFVSKEKIQRPLLGSGGALIGIALLAGALLVALPWLLVQVYNADGKQAFYVGGVSLLTVAGVLLRMFINPLRRYAPRLGGVALGVLVLAIFALVVHDSAVGTGFFGWPGTWLTSVAACLLLAHGVDTQLCSMRELYRARLTNSFVEDRQRPASLYRRLRRRADRQLIGFRWSQLAEVRAERLKGRGKPLPELHVCCSASRVGLQPNGMAAEAFTISQDSVRHYRATGTVTVPTSTYVKSLNSLALEMLKTPAGWFATSGAAFASAMGQHSLGSTNALLAAANVDLGVWLPAPAAVQGPPDGETRTRFPPVGLGHLFNEIFGFYSERDDMIFVSDGGHVENLGLVELLRNGARRIICIDASGDEPGSFATLHAALRYADATLPDDARLEFDTSELDSSPDPPRTSAYRIPIRRRGGPPAGIIYYAKLQAATDQKLNLRQFANSDPRFPNYSTANQLLDDQQFAFLLFAGQQAGRSLVALLEGER